MKTNHSNGQLTYQLNIDHQQKNGFPIPCNFLTTGKIGVIYPTQALEVTYGDFIRNNTSAVIQFNPLAVPMMANMFIKQEHYYTPYNDVWENWDNFISGGEDLNFTTPPPTFSMKQLIDKLNALFALDLTYQNVTGTGNGSVGLGYLQTGRKYLYVKIPERGYCQRKLSEHAYAFFAQYGMVDLYKHFVLAAAKQLDAWFDYHRQQIDTWKDTISPDGVSSFIISSEYLVSNSAASFPVGSYILLGADKNAEISMAVAPVDGSSTGSETPLMRLFPYDYVDKNIAKFRLSLSAYEQDNYDTEETAFYANDFQFLELGKDFIRHIYKMYKPFCGVGSILDCINLNRFTDEHFEYLLLGGIIDAVANQSDVVLCSALVSDMVYSALVLRVNYLIWFNNYRDQLLETTAFKPSRLDTITDSELICLTIPRVRCWDKDSYTTALDNPATADAVVPTFNAGHEDLVVSTYQNLYGKGVKELKRNDATVYQTKFADGEVLRIPTGLISGLLQDDTLTNDETTAYFSLHILDAVKRAQKFMRKALFNGNRIQDFIYSTWAVKHLDARLRLPELIRTSSSMVKIQTLVNNTTTAESVAGDRAGFATGGDDGAFFERFCEETGVIMSYLTVMPQPTYAYGSDRKYCRLDRFDFPMPDFATLGMDAVFDSEIMSTPVKVFKDGQLTSYPSIFGYQGRYYDSKFRQSTEHGEFLTTQDMYTFGRRFDYFDPAGRPVLNYEFVHCFPPLDMFVMDDRTEDYWKADVYHDTEASLTLPYHSIYL